MNRIFYTLVCIAIGLPFIGRGQLNANFNAALSSNCAPVLVTFTDLSTGNPISWKWNFGDGGTNSDTTIANASHTYFNAGTYTVTLTVNNGTSTSTTSQTITVAQKPQVSFTASDSSITCSPKSVTFNSVAGASTYNWDFGDGSTSTTPNPSHTYSSPGVYNITLVVSNNSGCTNSFVKTNYITVKAHPSADFTSGGYNPCVVPSTVNFTNNSNGAISYLWDFGDGTTSTAANPSHNYNSSGSYTVRLITSNGYCSDTVVKNAHLTLGSLTAAFTSSPGCIGQPTTFINTSSSTSTTYAWSFGDGGTSNISNPSHAYAAGGSYNVKLVITSGSCKDSVTHTVTVAPKPVAKFSISGWNGCISPFPVTFTNASTGATSYLWIFGDGTTSTATSPTHNYTGPHGSTFDFKLVAINSSGCTDTVTLSVAGEDKVVIWNNYTNSLGASPASVCAGGTVHFTPDYQWGYQPPVSYTWDFGDGTTLTGNFPTPNHTYTSFGSYTVTVTFTTPNGCLSTPKSTVINVVPKPTASFTVSPTVVCPNQTVQFTNTSTGTITGYTWLFGDGTISNLPNPSTTYEAGTYTVKLIVSNGGCIDTMTQTNVVTVHPPKADYTFTADCNNRKSITFTNTSVGAQTSLWDFGDGTPSSTTVSPVHTYASNGTYTVKLTATNLIFGCTDTIIKQVKVFDIVNTFSTNDTSICKGGKVNVSAPANPDLKGYTWYFGDGTAPVTPAVRDTSHTYTAAGTYTLSLVVKDIYNCKDSFVRTDYVKVNSPIVAFSNVPPIGCAKGDITFINQTTSAVPGTSITSYFWRFGDGDTSNLINPIHAYNNAGTYTVTLIATTAGNCKDSSTHQGLVINPRPTAKFSVASDVCTGQAAVFSDSSSGNSITRNWDFGDNTFSTATNPSHAYSATGAYTVKLIVTSAGGCSDTFLKVINVGNITVGFNASDTLFSCPPANVTFTNTSIGATSYLWSLGNGNSSISVNASTVYTTPGTYVVKLVATNTAGCKDSFSKTIHVEGPTGTISYSPKNGCSPLTVTFTATTNNAQSLIWDFDNGVTQTSTGNTITYTYSQSGYYLPKLILGNGSNCNVAISGIDTIKADGIAADFSFVNNSCLSAPTQFIDTIKTISAITRSWSFGDGGTSNLHNPTHTYTTPGTYNVRLIIDNLNGCHDTVTHQITILPKPVISAGSNKTICIGSSIALQATGGASYLWTPATGLSCTNCSNPTAAPTSTTTYTVKGTAANGCSDTSNVTVTVVPPPILNAGSNQTICQGASVTLNASGGSTYSWSPSTGLSCTNCSNPVASPSATTTYTLIDNSLASCPASAQVTITVKPAPVINAGIGQAICKGSSTTLNATGSVISYSWSPSTGLSNPNIPNPTASPASTTTYTVTGSDTSGCSNSSQVTVTILPPPSIAINGDNSICAGASTSLIASGATTYVWSPSSSLSNPNIASPVASPATTTTYLVVGKDNNGCIDSSSITVSVIQHTPTSVGTGDTLCRGESTTLNASGGQSYLWIPGDGLSNNEASNPSASPQQTTTYKVLIKENECFTDTGYITVVVNPQPTVNLGPDQIVYAGESIKLNPSITDATMYKWTPGESLSCDNCPDPTATPTRNMTYTIVVSNIYGCTAKDDISLKVQCDNSQIFIPNTFTPNGDGQNDIFFPQGKGVTTIKSLRIFDRWGEVIFSASNMPVNDASFGWDGTYKGQTLKPDTYVYILDATCVSGEPIQIKGDVSLIR